MPAASSIGRDRVAAASGRWRAGERVEVLRTALLDVPAAVPDPRDPRGVRYSVMALLAIAILATAVRALVALEPPQRTAR